MVLAFVDNSSKRVNYRTGIDYSKLILPDSFERPDIWNIRRELRTTPQCIAKLMKYSNSNRWGEEHFDRPTNPTLFIQGVMGPSWVMGYQRSVLENRGISCANIGPRINLGPLKSYIEQLEADFLRLYEESGQQKMNVVCHSLGGVFALYLAYKFPEKVDKLILETSVLEASSTSIGSLTNLYMLERLLRLMDGRMHPEIFNNWLPLSEKPVLDVDMMVLAAYHDGVIDFRASLSRNGENRVNLIFDSTHIEIIARRSVAEFIGDVIENGIHATPSNSANKLIIPDTGTTFALAS